MSIQNNKPVTQHITTGNTAGTTNEPIQSAWAARNMQVPPITGGMLQGMAGAQLPAPTPVRDTAKKAV